jgi:hypothetical protein
VLTLAYRCSEENVGGEDEYWCDYEEFWGMRIPQSSCLWKSKMELLVALVNVVFGPSSPPLWM